MESAVVQELGPSPCTSFWALLFFGAACLPAPSAPAVAPGTSPAASAHAPRVLVGPRTPQVVGGSHHTCAVLPDGGVACWGDNSSGQLGDGTGQPSRVPVRVAGVFGVIALASGDTHTCALQRAGTVMCWGENGFGQLGVGTISDRGTAQTIRGLTRVASIAAVGHKTCVLQDAIVSCWGLEKPSYDSAASPRVKRTLHPSTQEVCVGETFMCARHGSTVSCWSTIKPHAEEGEVPGLVDADALSCGEGRACVVRSDASVACWGAAAGDEWWSVKAVPGVVDAIDIAVGGGHACALHRNGAVSCWGDNDLGELGNYAKLPDAVHAVPVSSPMAAVGLGQGHSCGRFTDGRFACWGGNPRGASGWGKEPISLAPERIAGLSGIDGVVAAGSFTCAHRRNEALCWGRVNGLLPLAELQEPTPVDAFRRARGVVSMMDDRDCIWSADGSARCLAGPSIPASDVLQIAPIRHRMRAWVLRSDGVWSEPYAEAMVLPDDFVAVPGAKPQAIVEVAPWTYNGICAHLRGGAVRCLDDLGADEAALDMVIAGPRRPRPVTNVRSLRYSEFAICVLLGDGTVACQDRWYDGDQPIVEVVPGLRDVAELAAGERHFCARTRVGEVLCWGANDGGQLGDGTTVYNEKPGQVSGLTGVRALALGDKHTCALTQQREVFCWGDHLANGRLSLTAANARSASPVVVGSGAL